MKKILCALIALLLTASLALSVSAASPSAMTVFGDSIATGYGLDGYAFTPDSAKTSFSNLLAARYGLTYGESYYNFAVDGMTSAGLNDLLSSDPSALVAAAQSDTVVISIGGNDLLGILLGNLQEGIQDAAPMLKLLGIDMESMDPAAIYAALPTMMATLDADGAFTASLTEKMTSPETQAKYAAAVQAFGANYAELLGKIYAVNPGAKIYHLCLYNPFSGVEMFAGLASLADTLIDSMADAADLVALGYASKGFSITEIKVKDAFDGKAAALTNIIAVDIHPNQAGHAILADAFDAAISAADAPAAAAADAPVPTAASAAQTVTSPVTADSSAVFFLLLSMLSMTGAVCIRKTRVR